MDTKYINKIYNRVYWLNENRKKKSLVVLRRAKKIKFYNRFGHVANNVRIISQYFTRRALKT